MKFTITPSILRDLGEAAAAKIYDLTHTIKGTPRLFGVPRGGVSAALAIGNHLSVELVEDVDKADIIVDDLIDSGVTMHRWSLKAPEKPFIALLDKRTDEWKGKWVIFPWETNSENSIGDNIVRLLQFVGEDPKREGLAETPARVARAWQHWCGGYGRNAKDVLKVFEDGAEKHNQMITVQNIPFYSHCEHHLAPFFGTATVAYIPKGKIVGLSKMSRLVDIFSRRLQVQERLTDQIADALNDALKPKGVGVCLKARHLCMESRGVCQQGHSTMTTALRGVLLSEEAARAEFLQLVR